VDRDELGRLLVGACDLAGAVLAATVDRSASGLRDGQYNFDLEVDGPMIEMLTAAGLGVLSEEAGEVDLDRALVAVVDPVDGSTNAAHGIPWYATSICVVDDRGPLQSTVVNHATGTRFEARRGEGATRNGVAMGRRVEHPLEEGLIGVNGAPPPAAPWGQFRALGAAALDLCAVADGSLDGYVDFDEDAHGVWDYLGGMLVCTEVGIAVEDAFGRPLVTLDHTQRRTPVAGGRFEVVRALRDLRTGSS
jgi:fructose-1,6-bisphosphatase/inositol monophosphatase family enzyme